MSRLSSGFTRVSSPTLKDPELNLQEKGLYAYLSTYADNDTFELGVTIKRIAAECNVSCSTAKRLMASLEDKGVIERKQQKHGKARKTVLVR